MISLYYKELRSILIDSLGMIFRRTCLCFSFFTSKIEALLEGLLKQPFFCCYAVRLSRNQLNVLPCTSVFKAALVPYQSILLLFHLLKWSLKAETVKVGWCTAVILTPNNPVVQI